MKYKYFLFDWDGSLADTLPDWFETHKIVLKKHGIEVTDEVVCKEVFGNLDVREIGITDVAKYLSDIESEIVPRMNKANLNPGVKDLLLAIKTLGGKIAVVTDSQKRWLEESIRKNGLENIIDAVVGRESVKIRKPDPEMVYKAFELIGGNAKEALMTGDNWRDVGVAKNSGMDSCLYFPKRYERFYRQEDQMDLGASYVISDFDELNSFFK